MERLTFTIEGDLSVDGVARGLPRTLYFQRADSDERAEVPLGELLSVAHGKSVPLGRVRITIEKLET